MRESNVGRPMGQLIKVDASRIHCHIDASPTRDPFPPCEQDLFMGPDLGLSFNTLFGLMVSRASRLNDCLVLLPEMNVMEL